MAHLGGGCVKQITVSLRNEPGALHSICDVLTRTGINIVSMFGEGLNAQGIVHLVTEDAETTRKILEKAGYAPRISEVMTVKVPDRPGELGKILRKLAHAQININTVALLTREKGEAIIAINVSDSKKAEEALKS